MSSFSSFEKDKKIFDNWRNYLTEEEGWTYKGKYLCDTFKASNPSEIVNIGQLVCYFKQIEPGVVKKTIARYGSVASKLIGFLTGIATGGISGAVAEKGVENLLILAVYTFANIEDGTYPEGSAASYFDLDDQISAFFRNLEHGNVEKPSKPEILAMNTIKKEVEEAIAGNVDPNTTIQDLLKDMTAKYVMDLNLRQGEHGGAVSVKPAGK